MVAPSAPVPGDPPIEPLVSVVIPAYNRARLIGAAVASALGQTYRTLEVIVVDDGSSDDIAAVCEGFADPRLRLVVHPQNRGAAAARNTGVAAAQGEFVAFLDSDDVWFADKIAQQVAAMHSQPPEVAGHVCGYACIKAGYRPRNILPEWTAATFHDRQFLGCTCGPGTTLLCRRVVFADVGPLDETLRRLEDWDWLLRLAEKGYRLLGSRGVLARVEVGSRPNPRAIEAAVRCIRERHLAAATKAGLRRVFEASLKLESASAAFADSAYIRAVGNVLGSLVRDPTRGGNLYWRLIQHGLRAVNLSLAQRRPPRA